MTRNMPEWEHRVSSLHETRTQHWFGFLVFTVSLLQNEFFITIYANLALKKQIMIEISA